MVNSISALPHMHRLSALVAVLIQSSTPLLLLGCAMSPAALLFFQEPSLAQPANIVEAQFYLSRAVEKRRAGNYQGALSDLNKSIQIAPNWNYGLHYINRGDLRQQLGDSYGAISDYNQAFALGNSFGTNYRRRGAAKAAIGDYRGAIADYNIAVGILSPPRQSSPDLVIEVHILRGNAWGAIGANQEACEDYKKAVSYGDQDTLKWLTSGNGAWCRNMP